MLTPIVPTPNSIGGFIPVEGIIAYQKKLSSGPMVRAFSRGLMDKTPKKLFESYREVMAQFDWLCDQVAPRELPTVVRIPTHKGKPTPFHFSPPSSPPTLTEGLTLWKKPTEYHHVSPKDPAKSQSVLDAEVYFYVSEAVIEWQKLSFAVVKDLTYYFSDWIRTHFMLYPDKIPPTVRKELNQYVAHVRTTFLDRYSVTFTDYEASEIRRLNRIALLLAGVICPDLPSSYFLENCIAGERRTFCYLDAALLSGNVPLCKQVIGFVCNLAQKRLGETYTLTYLAVLSQNVELLKLLRPHYTQLQWIDQLTQLSANNSEKPYPALFRALIMQNFEMAEAILNSVDPDDQAKLLTQEYSRPYEFSLENIFTAVIESNSIHALYWVINRISIDQFRKLHTTISRGTPTTFEPLLEHSPWSDDEYESSESEWV
ncbi:MAG: hypothetical protein S4CHLAM102_11240 [Chlamydiia bacterium]|nr:hypothetical protein [Chlamydiia bacterium]